MKIEGMLSSVTSLKDAAAQALAEVRDDYRKELVTLRSLWGAREEEVLKVCAALGMQESPSIPSPSEAPGMDDIWSAARAMSLSAEVSLAKRSLSAPEPAPRPRRIRRKVAFLENGRRKPRALSGPFLAELAKHGEYGVKLWKLKSFMKAYNRDSSDLASAARFLVRQGKIEKLGRAHYRIKAAP